MPLIASLGGKPTAYTAAKLNCAQEAGQDAAQPLSAL